MSSTESEYLIEGKEVTKVFKDFWGRPKVWAVAEVDIRVRRGAVFGLLGPNGAGKSTLIKLVLGHLYPTAGKLSVFGKLPTDVDSKARLGYLPERAHLYNNLTPRETLEFFGEVLELPKGVIRARADQLLEMVGLGRAKTRMAGEFSRGMSRRLGLAQALLNDPDLLLLDEPTAGLDPLGCREVKNLIRTLARRGKTIVLSSHLLADVEDVCDELLILYGGKVQAAGTSAEILARKDMLQINLPAPSKATLGKLHDAVAGEFESSQVEFSSPTRNLESYFLEVVSKASRTQETHGAQAGGDVAGYLKEGVDDKAEVLDSLASAGKETTAPSESKHSAAKPPDDDSIDRDLLDKLTKSKK